MLFSGPPFLLLQAMRRRFDSLESGAPSTSGRGAFPSYPAGHSNRPLNQFSYEESWDLIDDGGYTPFPVNLPTGEGAEGQGMELGQMAAGLHLSDSKEIWGEMGQVMQPLLLKPSVFGIILLSQICSVSLWRCLTDLPSLSGQKFARYGGLTWSWIGVQVFVLLFGVGEAETEGIYSLRAMSRDEGLPQDTIVAFEDLEDAERCALKTNRLLLKRTCRVHIQGHWDMRILIRAHSLAIQPSGMPMPRIRCLLVILKNSLEFS